MKPRRSRLRSFRVRITLLSTLVSATVLIIFGAWSFAVVYRTSMLRVDQNIRELGERHLTTRQGSQHWAYVNESLEFVLGDPANNPFILLVLKRDGSISFKSTNWPAALPPQLFPTPVDMEIPEEPDFNTPPGRMNRGRFGPWRRDDRPFAEGVPPDAPGEMAPPTLPGEPRETPAAPPLESWLLKSDNALSPPPPLDPQRLFQPMPSGPMPRPLPIRSRHCYNVNIDGRKWRIGVMSNPEVTLVLGLNLAPYAAETRHLMWLFIMALPAALLLIGPGGWWISQRALRPIESLAHTAENITAQGLDKRISVGQEDEEFEHLIQVFNNMLDRLEKSFQQAVRFSADAAHELKTPLTILQGELAQALQTAEPGSEQQETLNHLLEEVQRLKSITRKLLLLSLADSGRLKPQREPVDFSEMMEAACDDIESIAPHLRLEKRIAENLWVDADSDLLWQLVQNLTSNSIKYNMPEGVIRIVAQEHAPYIHLLIANTGPGIAKEDEEHIFERFFRADKAHNRRVDGMGLGLSLAREIARAHGGELRLEPAAPGWTAFSLFLPKRNSPPAA